VSTVGRTVRALPTLLRIGVAETVAYRAEFLVWILTTTQPLIMMSLWTSVARDRSFHGYTSDAFVAYYLSTLIVRQLTGNWVAWQMMEEIRLGTMAMRLLRPIHPFFAYVSSHLAAIPFRVVVALPLALILLLSSGASALSHDPVQLAVLPVSIGLAWLLTFAILFAIGSLAFFMTQTMALANLYFGMYALLSGYLLPLDLMPKVAAISAWLPFRYTLDVPVMIMTRSLTGEQLAGLVGRQLAWVAIMLVVALSVWRAGVRRFESVGG
jgi:viologen exporter family transport system permease protein